jgi:hypothetical protein
MVVSTLEETVAKLQARDIETQNKLDQLLAVMAQLTQTKQNASETPPLYYHSPEIFLELAPSNRLPPLILMENAQKGWHF